MREWDPDFAVVEQVICGRVDYAGLSEDDRRFVVAVLTFRGESSAQIGEWLAVSQRQVKRIRAELATRVMVSWLETRAELGESEVREARLRARVRSLCA